MVRELNPLVDKLNEITELMQKINKWELEKFMDKLSDISDILSYDSPQAKLIKFLFENFKTK